MSFKYLKKYSTDTSGYQNYTIKVQYYWIEIVLKKK